MPPGAVCKVGALQDDQERGRRRLLERRGVSTLRLHRVWQVVGGAPGPAVEASVVRLTEGWPTCPRRMAEALGSHGEGTGWGGWELDRVCDTPVAGEVGGWGSSGRGSHTGAPIPAGRSAAWAVAWELSSTEPAESSGAWLQGPQGIGLSPGPCPALPLPRGLRQA